ncbi:ATP-binding protein [Kitasatospora sp. NPDC127111]|uniref:ATP-binding protein n=1 Tax=Kitasatospora sp. NPDC127111 TaxID=3345363 RepID=UPI0036426EE3
MSAINHPEPASGDCLAIASGDDGVVLPAPDLFHVVADERAVYAARERIVAVATRWGVPLSRAALGDVKLCASEIITNALTHAGGECWVTAEDQHTTLRDNKHYVLLWRHGQHNDGTLTPNQDR